MRELETIKKELCFIQLYVRSCNGKLTDINKIISPKNFPATLEMYSRTLENAPKPLLWTYHELYLKGKKQKAAAIEKGVTEKYVQMLNKRLRIWLQTNAPNQPQMIFSC